MVARAVCALWGHSVDNRVFVERGRGCTRCGQRILTDAGGVTRVGHTLSCFLGHHTYERVGTRHGHNEYACLQCGHPLLFRCEDDPYGDREGFAKRVRYLCGLFGHRVHEVVARDGGVEYACHCGHTFVQPAHEQRIVRHPLACVLLGHWIAFMTARGGYSEYTCRGCGHPFLFKHGDRSKITRDSCHWRTERALAPTASSARSGPAAWGRSIAQPTRD